VCHVGVLYWVLWLKTRQASHRREVVAPQLPKNYNPVLDADRRSRAASVQKGPACFIEVGRASFCLTNGKIAHLQCKVKSKLGIILAYTAIVRHERCARPLQALCKPIATAKRVRAFSVID